MRRRGIRLLRSQGKGWLPRHVLYDMFFRVRCYISSAQLSRLRRRWFRCQSSKPNLFDSPCNPHKRRTHMMKQSAPAPALVPVLPSLWKLAEEVSDSLARLG